MKRSFAICLLSSVFLLCCSKNDSNPSDSIEGTWVFTNEITFSSPYPSVLKYGEPQAYSTFSLSNDSIRIVFDHKGNYSFSNFRLPADKGTYSIAHDSSLIIKPDTSAFVKFNYALPVVVFGTGTTINQPLPVIPFYFTSDTILFKRTGNTITFSGAWLSKADSPAIPGGDTMKLNKVINYFKRQ